MIDKLIEIVTNENHDKLTDFILRIANTVIQLFLGVLIIIYSFESFVFLFGEKEIQKNKLYIEYVKEYIDMANKFATSGTKIFESLIAFGAAFLMFSYIIWLTFDVIGRKIKVESFFIGDLLVFVSLGFTFWSAIFWFVLYIAANYLKYYLFALPVGILSTYWLFRVLSKINKIGKKKTE
ncbi:hypothetical protein ACQCPP_31765 (plasmid) [Priestia megaterium]|uniref:hypothetical protein n=1 Tax=Priestia megaterium TaxID=1404 RepID=UPI003D03B763